MSAGMNGAGAPGLPARQPWRLGPGRRLAPATTLEHLDDLVRAVLLTGAGERLHRPGFGAGLGASTLFEPLSGALGATVSARAHGSLSDALGDRIQVIDVVVSAEDSTLTAAVTYRPLPAGASRSITLTLPGGAT
jgi:phage baseplate assembly protein W